MFSGRFPFLKYEVFAIQDGDGGIRHDPAWLQVIREGFGEKQIHHQGTHVYMHNKISIERVACR